jgi:hypothetical protein
LVMTHHGKDPYSLLIIDYPLNSVITLNYWENVQDDNQRQNRLETVWMRTVTNWFY